MLDSVLVFAIIFLAVFIQSFLGFGSAIIAIGLLPVVIGLPLATPLFALIAILFELVLVFYYRHGLEFNAIWRLVASNILGIPFGIYLLNRVPEQLMLTTLGMVILSYGLYSLSNFKLPEFKSSFWSYFFGLISGAFGGAYAISGPPVIIYGHGRKWSPQAFKGNLQAFFILTSMAIVFGHMINGSYTAEIWPWFRIALPAAALGLAAGIRLDRFIEAEVFHKAVLGGIVLLGLILVF